MATKLKPASKEKIKHTKSKDLVSIETIKGKLAQIDGIDDEIKRLKDLRKQIKEEVNDLVLSVDAFGDELESFVFDAYWNLKHINANPLRALIAQRTGDDRNWQRVIVAVATVTCTKCGQEFKKEFKSKTSYNDTVNRGYSNVCADCELRQKQESEAHRKLWQQEVSERINDLRSMSYSEYLTTDHWQATRKRALKRASFKCQLCSSNGKLHVHHRTYENLGNESNADLIVLCETCHGKFHDKITETVK